MFGNLILGPPEKRKVFRVTFLVTWGRGVHLEDIDQEGAKVDS